jgi:hypothetical protein
MGPRAPRVVLATLNARWSHTALGLRCLKANLGALAAEARILEFLVSDDPEQVADALLAAEPALLGLGVYVWNVEASGRLLGRVRARAPELPVVLGGPELIDPEDPPPLAALADAVIAGEAERLLPAVAARLLRGERKIGFFLAEAPDLDALVPPWSLYTEEDLSKRNVYFEASRGCAFGCEFCLSSLDRRVRRLDERRVLEGLESLFRRGARRFRFLDRTLHLSVGEPVLRFLLERAEEGIFVHFELVPDPLPEHLRPWLAAFPPGVVQVEVGVQSFDPEVTARVRRRQDPEKVAETLRFLREETGVHVHADLVAGLPGEGLPSFAAGFDRLVGLRPQEIQVGLLKKLRGAPIARHAVPFEMRFSPRPPYAVLETRDLSGDEVKRLAAFSQAWDRVSNSGRFLTSLPLLWEGASPFASFLGLVGSLLARHGRCWGLSEDQLGEALLDALIGSGVDARRAAEALIGDRVRLGRSHLPPFLKPWAKGVTLPSRRETTGVRLAARQRRHGEGVRAPSKKLTSP